MSKNIKSSSGDLSNTNPYIRVHAGTEVTTSKIVRFKDHIEIKIYQKRI